MDLTFLNKEQQILVIDDSKLNRAIIIKNLKELNVSIDEANDGIEGLDTVKKKQYDLILVDLIMPNMNGFEFLVEFKKISTEFVPVILMTGSDDLTSKIKGLQVGADDFLLKPLNEKELVARTISLLRLRNANLELFEKNQVIQKELETAKRVQQYIIPKDFSYIKYPKISGRYFPIEDIGGDFFDCYNLSDGRIGLLIADVTGHGIPAALVMSMSKMTFSVYAESCATSDELLSIVNSELRGLLLDYQYITCFYIIYNDKTKQINYTNAGHTRALYFKKALNKIIGLDTKGFFIGISDNTDYERKFLKVETGDRLFLYTDGLTEIKNKENKEFGENRLAKFIIKNKKVHGDQFCDKLLHLVNSFTPIDSRNDDVAFLNIEF